MPPAHSTIAASTGFAGAMMKLNPARMPGCLPVEAFSRTAAPGIAFRDGCSPVCHQKMAVTL